MVDDLAADDHRRGAAAVEIDGIAATEGRHHLLEFGHRETGRQLVAAVGHDQHDRAVRAAAYGRARMPGGIETVFRHRFAFAADEQHRPGGHDVFGFDVALPARKNVALEHIEASLPGGDGAGLLQGTAGVPDAAQHIGRNFGPVDPQVIDRAVRLAHIEERTVHGRHGAGSRRESRRRFERPFFRGHDVKPGAGRHLEYAEVLVRPEQISLKSGPAQDDAVGHLLAGPVAAGKDILRLQRKAQEQSDDETILQPVHNPGSFVRDWRGGHGP